MLKRILPPLGILAILTQAVFADPLGSVDLAAGKIKEESLRKLAPQTGFIADQAAWDKLWTLWRIDDKPAPPVDFTKELVLVGTVPGPNHVMMRPSLEMGDVKFIVGGTKIGGPGFGYRILKINREGVTSVNGNALDNKNATAEESITVKVIGTLETGIVAIGGETTGTTITAKGITWELDLGKNNALRQMAEKLSGKKAIVQGQLEKRKGIEIPERWIVTVTGIKPAG